MSRRRRPSRLGDRRAREDGRRLPVRRCRRHVEAGEHATAGCGSARSTTRASTPTRRRRTPSTSSTPGSTARRTRARRTRPSACRTATTTTCGSRRRPAAHGQRQRRRRQRVGQRRADVDGPGLSRPRSSTTCSRRGTCRTTCAARSRTTAPRACRARGRRDVLYAVGGGESGYVAPDPKNLDVFFAGSYGGLTHALRPVDGAAPAGQRWPENPMGHSSRDIKERVPVDLSRSSSRPARPDVAVHRLAAPVADARTRGSRWQRISPDLTRNDPATTGPSGGPITLDQTGVETYATIFTIAPSRHERGTIWVGSDDGVVHVTRDGGKTWANVTPRDLPEFARISLIEASPHDAGTAYVAGEPLPARRPRALRLPDRRLRQDLDEDRRRACRPTTSRGSIREDIERPGLLFLGTEHGVYVSFDDGGALAVAAARPAGDARARAWSSRRTTSSSGRTAEGSTCCRTSACFGS